LLWDRHADDQTPARLGHLVLILAVAAFILSLRRGAPAARRVVGSLIIAVAVVYWIQTVLIIKGDFGAPTGEALKDIGLGVYLAIAGGVLLLLGRRKPDRSPALPSG